MDPKFKCKRCGYEIEHKHNQRRHLQRHAPCDASVCDVSVDSLIKELDKQYNEITYDCEFCGKKFNSRSNKSRHKATCSSTIKALKDQADTLTNIVNTLQNRDVSGTLANSTNITNNAQNNINVHINVRDFGGQENTKYLDNEFLMECLKEMDLFKVLEELHFNPEHPENHNVRLKNIKQNLMEYADQERWIVKKKDKVLYEMVMNGWRILDRYNKRNTEEIEDTLEEDEIREAVFWLKRIYNEDKELFKKIKEEIYELVMTNKKLMKV
jgi:transposase-like protein